MLLIADSGSTKTDWVLTDGENKFASYNTVGYNPYFISSENIYLSLSQSLTPRMDPRQVKKVIFYGAGCSTSDRAALVQKALVQCFTNSEVYVHHDMLAAARALLGTTAGMAAILGTGSNTCIYDGAGIEKNIDSLGYLLGDEGSGSYIGKKIVRDYMRGYLPFELDRKFMKTYKLRSSDIFDALYNQVLPNRFLAGFCKFAHEHKDHAYIRKIVHDAFSDFFTNLVTRYPGYEKYTFNCVGTVGFIFQDILTEVAESHRMKVGKLISSPIKDLVNYHLEK